MPGMSRTNSARTLQGFSVFQPALGSALQWLPDLGSCELDEMLHTFLPGPASIQDKRAHISMDFYEFARQTGETFKFYPVYTASFASTTTTGSPASSSAMHDSGYGSSFNVSPVVSSTSPWTPALSASTPASTASDAHTRSRSGPSRRTTPTGSRSQLDFSNHPGMRILTKDGRDITNSASRGCKSKEQRDHAHLMRIIKACDACRRKKIRCDPSHKKRTSSQAQPAQPRPKPARKAKTVAHEPTGPDISLAEPSSLDLVPSFGPEVTLAASSLESLDPEGFWQQFVHLDGPAVSFQGEDLDSILDPAGFVASSNGSSLASPAQSFLPSTPAVADSYDVLPDLVSHAPVLPYLNPGDSYGTDYQDFNLYSPTSELLDEEPQFVTKPRHKGHTTTSQRDDMPESGLLRHTPPELPNIDDHAYLYSGQSQQVGGFQEPSATDWYRANAANSIDGMHETDTAIPGPDETRTLFAAAGQPRPQPSTSLSSGQRPSCVPPSGGLGEVPRLDGNVQSTVFATSAGYAAALAPSAQGEPAPAFINERLYSSRRLVETPGPQPTASQLGDIRARARSTGLVQASVLRLATTAGDSPSATLSAAVKDDGKVSDPGVVAPAALQQAAPVLLRRGLSARSVPVLERRTYSDVVVRDRAADSLVTGIASHETDGANGAAGNIVGAGLRGVPRAAHSTPSASGLSALPRASMSAAALTGSVTPSSSTQQDVPGVPSVKYRTAFPGKASAALNHLPALGLVSCLLVLLMRRASLVWQRGLELALLVKAFPPSPSSCRRARHECSVDTVRSTLAEPAGLLWRSVGGATARCLLAH